MFEEMEKSLKKFIKELNLKETFFEDLLKEDDWSFIIKLSALLEAVSTQMLISKFGNKLEEAISYMDYANNKSGKIRIMYDCEIINKNQYNALRKLAEIRNEIVHNIENVNFTFEIYLSNNNNKINEFIQCFGFDCQEKVTIKENIIISKEDFIKENPKLTIWSSIYQIIACIHLDKEVEDISNGLHLPLKRL